MKNSVLFDGGQIASCQTTKSLLRKWRGKEEAREKTCSRFPIPTTRNAFRDRPNKFLRRVNGLLVQVGDLYYIH